MPRGKVMQGSVRKPAASSVKPRPLNDIDGALTETLVELHHLLPKLRTKHEQNNSLYSNIEAAYEQICARDGKFPFPSDSSSKSSAHKLKSLCTSAMKDVGTEADILKQCIGKIIKCKALKAEKKVADRHRSGGGGAPSSNPRPPPIRRGTLMLILQQNAAYLPLFIGAVGEKPPPLCGCIPAARDYVCPVGAMVAALVKNEENEENWILAEVVRYNDSNETYDIDDIDEEQKETHTLKKSQVIPLPTMKANPITDSDALYLPKTCVLALYPQTTCFYRGVIERVPRTHLDDYLVLFEDVSYPGGYSPPLQVPQKYVVMATR